MVIHLSTHFAPPLAVFSRGAELSFPSLMIVHLALGSLLWAGFARAHLVYIPHLSCPKSSLSKRSQVRARSVALCKSGGAEPSQHTSTTHLHLPVLFPRTRAPTLDNKHDETAESLRTGGVNRCSVSVRVCMYVSRPWWAAASWRCCCWRRDALAISTST